jgi:hypothetical protein
MAWADAALEGARVGSRYLTPPAMGGAVSSESSDIEHHRRHLDALRRLLRLAGKIEDKQKPFASKRDQF